eukprot:2588298-Amphidinium_carterae.3
MPKQRRTRTQQLRSNDSRSSDGAPATTSCLSQTCLAWPSPCKGSCPGGRTSCAASASEGQSECLSYLGGNALQCNSQQERRVHAWRQRYNGEQGRHSCSSATTASSFCRPCSACIPASEPNKRLQLDVLQQSRTRACRTVPARKREALHWVNNFAHASSDILAAVPHAHWCKRLLMTYASLIPDVPAQHAMRDEDDLQ